MQAVTSASFLALLRKNDKFSEYAINNYPEIEANVRSYKRDPNCSCKHSLAKFFEANKDKILASMQQWINDTRTDLQSFFVEFPPEDTQRNVLKTTLPPAEQVKFKDVIGDIVEILPDPNEYKRIISIAREQWLYNGINILETVKFDPQTKQETVVWLLLFY